MHLQENTLFDRQNIAQYPLHHVTYAHAQFEVATPMVESGKGLFFWNEPPTLFHEI